MGTLTSHMTTEIFTANSEQEISSCFPVFKLLRPHLQQETFLAQVHRQQTQGFQIVAIRLNGFVTSAIGFREAEYLVWGKIIYIDDLITSDDTRGKGLAGQLLDWVVEYAKAKKLTGVHLDTGYARHVAHRFYLNKGFQIACHHLSLDLSQNVDDSTVASR
jgi:GNAT superfamily N-acetyltransferase